MPIQIRELVVTAVVDEQKQNLVHTPSTSQPAGLDQMERQALIQDCVDAVMKVLKQQGRR